MKTTAWIVTSRTLIIAVFMATGAGLFFPDTRSDVEADTLPQPPPLLLLKSATLGRERVAADWMWLRALQFMGKPGVAENGYPGLGEWMERIVDLVPSFEAAYMRTAVLLSTVPEQLDSAERLLSRAEQNLVHARCRRQNRCQGKASTATASADNNACTPCPALKACNWEIPLWRGFVSYFGKLEANAAAAHFCESRRRGGPPYLEKLARRLKADAKNCASLRAHLSVFLRENAQAAGKMTEVSALLTREHQIRLLVKCEKQALQQAAGAYRLREGTSPDSVDELIREGLIAPPFAPSGQCWQMGDQGIALGPCPTTVPPARKHPHKTHTQ